MWPIVWRIAAFFVSLTVIYAIKTMLIAEGFDPYRVGRWLGSIDTFIVLTLLWRWSPWELREREDDERVA